MSDCITNSPVPHLNNNNSFTGDVTVTYNNRPTLGSITLSTTTGTVTTAVINTGVNSHTFTGVALTATGGPISLAANFSADPFCTLLVNDAGISPEPCMDTGCTITSVELENMSDCINGGNDSHEGNDFFTADVVVCYINPPSTGTLLLNGIITNSVAVGNLSSSTCHTFSTLSFPTNFSIDFDVYFDGHDSDCGRSMPYHFGSIQSCSYCRDLFDVPEDDLEVTVVDKDCNNTGSISAPSTDPCPPGSTLKYSTDGGPEWSTTIPPYDPNNSITIYSTCECNDSPDTGRRAEVTTNPEDCTTCDLPTLSATASSTCPGLSQGSIDLVTAGGTGTFSYLWSTGAITEDIMSLAAGTYSVTITVGGDSNCTVSDSYTIDEFSAPSLTGDNITVCAGEVITFDVEDIGAGGDTYNWATTSGNGFTSSVQDPTVTSAATMMDAGTYTVTFTDENGCIATLDIEVIVNPVPTYTAILLPESACGSDGVVLFTFTNVPDGNYDVTFSDANSMAISLTNVAVIGGAMAIGDLEAGDYSNFVIQGIPCISEANVQFSISGTEAASISDDSPRCDGEEITITVTRTASTSHRFFIDADGDGLESTGETLLQVGASKSYSSSSLDGGDKVCVIVDYGDCNETLCTTIDMYDTPACTTTSTVTSCGLDNGSTTVTASAGTGPYTYLWSNGAITAAITSLAAATYAVTVTDANGCTGTCSAVVASSSAPNINEGAFIQGCRSVIGGPSIADYTLSDAEDLTFGDVDGDGMDGSTATVTYHATQADALACINALPISSTMSNNDIYAKVEFSDGCSAVTLIDVRQRTGPTYTLKEIIAPACISDPEGKIVFSGFQLSRAYSVEYTDPSGTLVNINSSSNAAGEFCLSGLSSGSYTGIRFYITELGLNCYGDPINAEMPQPVGIAATIDDLVVCTGSTAADIVLSSANANNAGLSHFKLDFDAAANTAGFVDQPAIASLTGGTITIPTGLAAGTYNGEVCLVYDNGCQVTDDFTITVHASPTLSDASLCAGSSITMVGSGTPAFPTSHSSSDMTVATVSPSGVVTGIAAGTSTITYTDDNGCTVDATVTVYDLPTASTGVMPEMCLGSADFTITGSPVPGTGETGTWSGGTGFLSNINTAAGTATFNASSLVAGTYPVTYTFVDANGCQASDMGTVVIYSNPTLTGTASVCTGATVDLVGSGTAASMNAYTSSDTNVATVDATGTVTGVAAGTATITYTDSNGCTATLEVTVLETPTVTIANPTICYDGTTPYDLTSLEPTGMTGGTWTDYMLNAIGSTMVTPGDGHAYNYTFVGTNGCPATATVMLTVNSAPPATIEDIMICVGDTAEDIVLSTSNADNANLSHFKLDFDTAAETAGFVDQPGIVSLTGGMITMPIGLAPGTYNGEICLVYDNFCQVTDDFTITVEDCRTDDVALRKVLSSSGPFMIGDKVAFTITVFNQGTHPIYNVDVNDYLPTDLDFVAADNTGNDFSTNPDTAGGGTVTATVANTTPIAPGASYNLTIVLTINSSATMGTNIFNDAEITGATEDADGNRPITDEDDPLGNMGGGTGEDDDNIDDDSNGNSDALTDQDDFDMALLNLCDGLNATVDSPTVCKGTTSAPINLNVTEGTVEHIQLFYNPAASAAGFVDYVPLTSPYPTDYVIPAGLPDGVYTGVIVIWNADMCNTSIPFTITVECPDCGTFPWDGSK